MLGFAKRITRERRVQNDGPPEGVEDRRAKPKNGSAEDTLDAMHVLSSTADEAESDATQTVFRSKKRAGLGTIVGHIREAMEGEPDAET